MNTVSMIGRLTKEVDLRTTNSSKRVGTFMLAVNRNYTNQNGEREADFFPCVIWGKSADNLEKYATKGTLIGVTGRLQSRSYETNEGQKNFITEIVVETYQLLEPKNVNEQRKIGNLSMRNDEPSF